ncbi:serine/threonine-protein kinase PRP4 homolog [Penaeus indicus]|uniref:serine/threonine-protein kinase PRP4 homolog n=1 Tax=Penaeus indicus TaxID=29960 RepID=UPI00300C2553
MVPKLHRKVKRRHLSSSSSSSAEESQDEDLLDGPSTVSSLRGSDLTTVEYQMRLQHLWKLHQLKFQKYYDKPHTHSKYYKEWGQFVRDRSERIVELGEDPLTYDFETEWKGYWKHRLSKLEVEDWNEKKEKYLGLVKKGHGVSDRRRKYKSGSSRRSSTRSMSSSRSSTTSSTVSTGTSSSSSRTKSRSSSSSSRTKSRSSSSRSKSRSRSRSNLKERARRSRGRSCSRLESESRLRSRTERKEFEKGHEKSKNQRAGKIHSRRHSSPPIKQRRSPASREPGGSSGASPEKESPKKSSGEGKSTPKEKGKDRKRKTEIAAAGKGDSPNHKFRLEELRKHLLKELDKLDNEFQSTSGSTTPEMGKDGMETDIALSISSPKNGEFSDADMETQLRKRKTKLVNKAGLIINRELKKTHNLEERDSDSCSEDVQSIYEVEEKSKKMNIAIELNFEKPKLELNFGKKPHKLDLSYAVDKQSTSSMTNFKEKNTKEVKERESTTCSINAESLFSKGKAPQSVGKYVRHSSEKREREEKTINTLKLLCNLKDLHPQLAAEVVDVYDFALRLRNEGESPTRCLEEGRSVIILRRVCTELQASIALGNLGDIQKIYRGEIVKLVEDTLESYLLMSNRFLYDLDIKAIAQCTLGGSKSDVVKFIRDALVCSAMHIPTVENLAGILDAVLQEQSKINGV